MAAACGACPRPVRRASESGRDPCVSFRTGLEGSIGQVRTARDPARRATRLRALAGLARSLARPLEPRELFRLLYRETGNVLDATIFLFGLYHEESQTVEVVGQIDSGKELPAGSFPLGSGFTSDVIRSKQSRLIRRWSTEGPRIQVLFKAEAGDIKKPESGVTAPILWEDRVLGVLSAQSYAPEAYDEEDLRALEAIAAATVTALRARAHALESADELRARVAELETILASMADALVIVDDAERIVRLNPTARRLLRLEDHTLVLGRSLEREQWQRWPQEAREVAEALEPMIRVVREGSALSDVEVELPGTGRRILSFSGAPLRTAQGSAAGGVIVFRDVTERRALERLRDEILSVASHDLRTPITAIRGQAQVARRRLKEGGATPALDRTLATIEAQATRLGRLTSALLDLSLIELSRFRMERDRMDLVTLARGAIDIFAAMSDRHRVTLEAPEKVEGDWDRARLDQVLQNLLANAVKFSAEGGAVTLTISEDGDDVTACVKDEGVGIEPAELPRIFERFYRAEGARRLEGSGLGLYIGSEVVRAHGGRIWAESPGAGMGALFCFSLPRSPRSGG